MLEPDSAVTRHILERTPFTDLWGVARRTGMRLADMGIHTAWDLREADPKRMRQLFSVVMERTVWELRGIDCIETDDIDKPKQHIMTSRSFGRLTIFGYYDEKKKGFTLPSNHFAFEYQMALPMSVANQLIADLLLNEEPLFGGTGSYMQKQKERVKAGEIQVENVRADTERRVKSGAISYRPTLLGAVPRWAAATPFYSVTTPNVCLARVQSSNLRSSMRRSRSRLMSWTITQMARASIRL